MAESIDLSKDKYCNEEDGEEDDEQEQTKSKKKKGKKTDFLKMSTNLIGNINYKVSFMLFVVSMLIFSDMFIDNVLNKFSDSVQGECTTTKGTVIQLLFMVVAYIILDLVVKYEIL
jgi:hypothetical protein